MKRDTEDLGREIEQLLTLPEYRDHPLHKALALLWSAYREQTSRLERVTHISDGYQSLGRQRESELSLRFQKQMRKLEKLARISDHYQRMMQDANIALSDASNRDVLTGLANRRHLMRRLKEESERSSRSGQPYALAMLDVDHFKQVNDSLGHAAGDQVLIEISRILESSLREYDICGRWGGEEFMVILPGTPIPEARGLAQRVCERIRAHALPPREAGVKISASVGISEHSPGEHYADTVERADTALLEAKRQGRDCIVTDGGPSR